MDNLREVLEEICRSISDDEISLKRKRVIIFKISKNLSQRQIDSWEKIYQLLQSNNMSEDVLTKTKSIIEIKVRSFLSKSRDKTNIKRRDVKAVSRTKIMKTKDIDKTLVAEFNKIKCEIKELPENLKLSPDFRNTFAATSHYYKHRFYTDPGNNQYLRVREYYEHIIESLNKLKENEVYQELLRKQEDTNVNVTAITQIYSACSKFSKGLSCHHEQARTLKSLAQGPEFARTMTSGRPSRVFQPTAPELSVVLGEAEPTNFHWLVLTWIFCGFSMSLFQEPKKR
ncbi:hypothetical protein KQX54_002723 [Cotesia glomerata]|uniref:Uncharacterized protein n=1 Tax=Cotesia glomerata TaxID=32391 RepID=A0AAV7IKF1_COTGL|nr:hypothetical protein KQX54_002723 [Cotesia glomerata]